MTTGPRRASLRAAQRSQAGVSLLEALIVVFLASVVVLVIAYGLQVSVETDGRTNRQQRMGLALSTLTDGLRRIDYVSCDGSTVVCPNDVQDAGGRTANALVYESKLQSQLVDADPSVKAALQGVTWKVDSVEYWDPVTYTTDTDPDSSTTSISATGGGGYSSTFSAVSGAQRITITVSIGGDSLTGSAVKDTGVGQ